MKKLLVLLIIIMAMASAFAKNSFVIPIESEFYDVIDTLYLLEGGAIPATSRPWSKAQAEQVLNYISANGVSDENAELYNSAKSILEKEDVKWTFDDGFALGLTAELFPEIYIHTNSEQFVSEEHWAYDFNDRNLFFRVIFEFGMDEFFYTFCDLSYSVDRNGEGNVVKYTEEELKHGIGALVDGELQGSSDYKNVNVIKSVKRYADTFSFNMPSASKYIDLTTPKRAFISFAGNKWSFMFGRERLNWGNSNVGNLIIDDHVDFHDLTRLQIFSDYFVYEWTNLLLDTNIFHIPVDDPEISIFMLHRLDFRPFKWLTFSISENLMYKTQMLNFGNLNPGNIFHNMDFRGIFNAIAFAEINITPVKGLNIYGQFALDQAKAPNEVSDQSDSYGILAGVEYTHKLGKGYMTENAEFVMTTPLLYRRDIVDFLTFHGYNTGDASAVMRPYYIGFPYGPDAMVLNLSVGYRHPEVYSLKLNLELLQKGEMTMLHSHNESGNNGDKAFLEDNKTPYGNKISQYLTLTLTGEYFFPEIANFIETSVETNISYVAAREIDKATKASSKERNDLQLAFAIKITL